VPNSGNEIFAVAQLTVGHTINESLRLGSLIDAEAETRSNLWFRFANNRGRNTNERLKRLE